MTLLKYLTSSVGKKVLMAISGLCLVGFVIVHLTGNLLIFLGPKVFNKYSHALVSNPLIYIAEAILVFLFLFHIMLGITLFIQNKRSRPHKYVMKKNTGRGATFASATMPYTGALVLAFLVYHIIHLKYGTIYEATYNNVVIRDIYKLIEQDFSQWQYLLIYIGALVLLGIHLSHGIHSCFQSLGLYHPKYNPIIKLIGILITLSVVVGFSLGPIFMFVRRL